MDGLIEINSLAHLDMLIKEKHGVIVGFTDNHESPDAQRFAAQVK